MLGNADEQVKKILIVLRQWDGVVNRVVAVAIAKALISRSDDESLKSISIENSFWVRSVFTQMGFVKLSAITSKPQESLKLINETTAPYLEKEREKLKLEPNHWGLLIIDVIFGQMTNPVPAKLKENYVKLFACQQT